jgi:hypothetical protein
MDSDDHRYTFNELNNEDRELLLSHGYIPGELEPQEMRDILEDLRAETGGDGDSDHPSQAVSGDERDFTE